MTQQLESILDEFAIAQQYPKSIIHNVYALSIADIVFGCTAGGNWASAIMNCFSQQANRDFHRIFGQYEFMSAIRSFIM